MHSPGFSGANNKASRCAGATQWDEPKGGQALTGPFVPSPTFTGAVEGYVFKMGSKGLGYYQDAVSGTAPQTFMASIVILASLIPPHTRC